MQLAPATTGRPPLPGTGTAYPVTVRGPLPKLDLPVPGEVVDRLHDAAERGRRDARRFTDQHPAASDEEFRDHFAALVGEPPSGADAANDLQLVRDAAASRTAPGLRDATWIDRPGLFALWNRHATNYYRSASTADADAAAALIADVDQLTSLVTFAVKGAGHRRRPFDVDPDGAPLAPGVSRVHGSSWPSGHSSRAWANAIVLGALLPDRAAELLDAATQVSWGRVYAAAHFPSDVVTGAYLGAAAAERALARAGR